LQGTVCDELTLSIDLAPTILAAAGLEAPNFMQGRDMAQLYLNAEVATKTWRTDFFYEWNQGSPHNATGHDDPSYIPAVFALIRKDYKYFFWPQVAYEQVFHMETDPFEEHDLWNTSSMQTDGSILKELRARYAYLKNRSQSGGSV
jgi:arylsulfatase